MLTKGICIWQGQDWKVKGAHRTSSGEKRSIVLYIENQVLIKSTMNRAVNPMIKAGAIADSCLYLRKSFTIVAIYSIV